MSTRIRDMTKSSALESGAVRDPKKEIALDGVKQRQTTQIQPQESQGHGRI
jgi:hypothetical protein